MHKQIIGRLLALLTLCLMAIGLAGCGGGGGGGGSTPPAGPDTVNGTVSNGGASTAGDVVKFDNLPNVTGAVGNGGTYTLTVPVADITGNDNLWIFDNSGNVIDVVPIVLSAGGGQTVTPNTALPAVPPPPGNGFAVGR